jgi:hypothetical protein
MSGATTIEAKIVLKATTFVSVAIRLESATKAQNPNASPTSEVHIDL